MKKLMITAALMAAIVVAKAQNYWVVESNGTQNSIVKIYNADHQLVNEKKLDRRIDINKKRERRLLDKFAKEPVLISRKHTS